jgi:hypothetical protein
MRIALPLAMALLTATALPSGLPASAAPLQDDEPSLVDMEADYMVLMSEADQLGRGRTIEQSIDFSTDRQGELRVQMEATEQLLRQQGANVRELGTARERFAIGEATNGFEDLAEEGAKELAEHIAEAGLSQGMKEVLGGIGLLLEVAESGAERYVQYLNTSDLLQGMRDGDGLFMANFRADRARQILSALIDPALSDFTRRRKISFAHLLRRIDLKR